MKIGQLKKHNIDIMFLMVLFLIFTFSAVSVLLMAVNSYRSVAYANEENASARIATSYIREQVRYHDDMGAITLSKLEDVDCIKMSEGEGVNLYIYEYNGFLMELEAKDSAGATPDFGNKILQIKALDLSEQDGVIDAEITDIKGESFDVLIGVKSMEVESDEKQK